MRIERHAPVGYAAEADWRRVPTAENATAAVASVGKTEEAAFKLRTTGSEALVQRRRERIEGARELADQAALAVSQAKEKVGQSEGENPAQLLDAVTELVTPALASDEATYFHIFPPLPSPLANVRAALRAYADQGATSPGDDLQGAQEVKELLKSAEDLLAGNGGISQTLLQLRTRGATTPAIESALQELEERIDVFREKLGGLDPFPKVPKPEGAEEPSHPLDVAV